MSVDDLPDDAENTPTEIQSSLLDTIAVAAFGDKAPYRAGDKIHGILIAAIDSVNAESGLPRIILPGLIDEPVDAKTLCAVDALKTGDQVAVMFEAGNCDLPIVMGVLQQPVIALFPSDDLVQTTEDGQLNVSAKKAINLQCGSASLRMTSDGRIELRGSNVVSHSTGLNRIRGASVKIN